jgi:predicted transcriptional regulator
MWSRVSEEYELGFVAQPLVVVRPDRDPNHLVADRRLLLQEARKYLKLYEERRRGKPRPVEEIRATQKFARALAKLEEELAETRSGGPPWR